MSKLERYPKYKDSGVTWLGEIPEEWEVRKLKFLGKIYAGLTDKKGDDFSKKKEKYLKPFIPFTNIFNNVVIDENEFQYVRIGENEDQHIVQKGDLLFLMSSETLEDIGKTALYDGETEVFLNSFCKGFNVKQDKISSHYLNWLLQSNGYRTYFSIVGRGFTRINIKQDYVNSLFSLLPPKQEQTKIANYLDQKTAQIDKAISLKEQMIERLKERRQILINDAVTKGLDKTVKMKDSEVEWIGEIPEHWAVEKGKRLFRQMKRPVRAEDEIITCFRDGEVTLRKNRRTDGFTNALKEHGYQGIRKGDLIIHNMDAFAGAIGISDSNGKSTPVYSVCIPWSVDLTLPEYYAYYLRHLAVQGFILSLAKGIRERSTDFRFNDFGELLFPVPPKSTQIEIMKYINNITEKTQQAILLYQKQIEKLKEYKATLIDNVVTGKIKIP